MLPSRKRTQGGASLCPGLSHFAPLGRTDRSTRKSSVITQQATEVLRLQLRPPSERATEVLRLQLRQRCEQTTEVLRLQLRPRCEQATEVLRLQLRPSCERDRRDRPDAAVMQAARRRVRAELRRGK